MERRKEEEEKAKRIQKVYIDKMLKSEKYNVR